MGKDTLQYLSHVWWPQCIRLQDRRNRPLRRQTPVLGVPIEMQYLKVIVYHGIFITPAAQRNIVCVDGSHELILRGNLGTK
jgi:hypothetical protein